MCTAYEHQQTRCLHSLLLAADSGVKFEGESAYDHDFHAHPLEKRAPMAPAAAPRNNAKFDGTSTYHVRTLSLAIGLHDLTNQLCHLRALRCQSPLAAGITA